MTRSPGQRAARAQSVSLARTARRCEPPFQIRTMELAKQTSGDGGPEEPFAETGPGSPSRKACAGPPSI